MKFNIDGVVDKVTHKYQNYAKWEITNSMTKQEKKELP